MQRHEEEGCRNEDGMEREERRHEEQEGRAAVRFAKGSLEELCGRYRAGEELQRAR